MNEKDIQVKILRKLMSRGKWGGAHTEIIHLYDGLPRHLRGTNLAKKCLKELESMDFLILKKSTGEIHVSLNPEKKKQIYEFLGLSYYDNNSLS